MLINGYRVIWAKSGFSYAVPVVYVRRTGLLRFLSPWKEVWQGWHKGFLEAKRMLPPEMERWFRTAIDDYENYESQWAAWRAQKESKCQRWLEERE